ncbi:hypothetical protein BDA96_03G153900 [Sorghum bicolor]|uniref:Uncharacterized protein n=1 Tax=Sorghum bicolor TaxID=4558 RepID=A0A921RE67_SORBI|nr:hypothetical protein BDA96_03G153900 [Sorghum bicolor]
MVQSGAWSPTPICARAHALLPRTSTGSADPHNQDHFVIYVWTTNTTHPMWMAQAR